MKFLILTILTLVSAPAFADVTPYLGVDLGFNTVRSYYNESSKTGFSIAPKGSLSLDLNTDWYIDGSVGFQYMKLTGSSATVTTKSLFAESDLQYRVNDTWSFGPTIKFSGGTDTAINETIDSNRLSVSLLAKTQFQTTMWNNPAKITIAAGSTVNLENNVQVVMVGLQFAIPTKKEVKSVTIRSNQGLTQIVEFKKVLIYFDTDNENMSDDETARLFKLAKYVRETNVGRIKISGHADQTGEASENKILSQNRADNVMKVFIKAGVSESRVQAHGYSSTRPQDEARLEKNRRVSVELLDVSNRQELNKKIMEIWK